MKADLTIKTTFFPHQAKVFPTIDEAVKRDGGHALFVDMGLGKTLLTLAMHVKLYNMELISITIVVAPKTLLKTWEDEIEKHLGEPRPVVLRWRGTVNKTFTVGFYRLWEKGGIFLVNVEAFQVANARLENIMMQITSKATLLVADESSKLKNPKANRTKRLLALAMRARFRSALTGTEVTNTVLDLWSQVEFCVPGFWARHGLRNFYAFRSRFAIMADGYGPGGRTFKKVVGFQKVDELQAMIAPIHTRLKKEDCLDLPAKRYQTMKIEMPPEMRKIYDQLKQDLMARYAEAELTVANKAVLFGRFRQLCGGFLAQEGAASIPVLPNAKLELLLDELEDTDDQAIIWACFTDEVRLLTGSLQGAVAVDGSVEIGQREAHVLAFCQGEARILVANPAVAAYGLNLQHVALVYWYSNPVSPEQRWQAEDRCHRIGQTRSVLYKDLVYEQSVDLRVQELLTKKTDLRQQFRDMSAQDFFNIF